VPDQFSRDRENLRLPNSSQAEGRGFAGDRAPSTPKTRFLIGIQVREMTLNGVFFESDEDTVINDSGAGSRS